MFIKLFYYALLATELGLPIFETNPSSLRDGRAIPDPIAVFLSGDFMLFGISWLCVCGLLRCHGGS